MGESWGKVLKGTSMEGRNQSETGEINRPILTDHDLFSAIQADECEID